ncbi:TonB family protein [Halomonas sp. NO4]|uniref:TonB family protein n=1 Tax=Halomonas sp. NO4 TaxID=2484813 RepID=UPI0013CF4184|nr:TonB family protein [Halomonas sp. NO4]
MPAALSDPIHYAPVTRPYRRWLAVSAALLVHLAVLGTVSGLPFTPSPPPATSVEVVLVTRTAPSPVEAEAIAARDQRAAGDARSQAPAESRAVPPAQQRRREAAEPAVDPASPAEPRQRATEVAAQPRESAPLSASSPSTPRVSSPSAAGRDLLAQSTQSRRRPGPVAEMVGPGDEGARQAAKQAAEARYIDDWTRRIEAYGNRVPRAPRDLHGQLRIRVVIGRDGELRQAEVVQSSGHVELDQAALETVHRAAPYRPFDSGMGALDSLSITRVWRFGQGNHYGVRPSP